MSDCGTFGVLVGVVTGGIITTGATLFLEGHRAKRDASALAHAFSGEMKALRTIVRKRRYTDELRAVIAHIQTNQQPSPTFSVRVRRDYFNVFKANIDKIRTLMNPLPERIAEFYVTANSVLEDLELISDGGLSGQPADHYLAFYSELLQLFEEALQNAEEIETLIKEKYP